MSIGNTYKNVISVITLDALNNYINSEKNPEENEFRKWLKPKKFYYLNRITARLLEQKPIEKTQAVGYIAVEIYKIMERDYESSKEKQTNDIGNSDNVI
jgi:hypothetical protein